MSARSALLRALRPGIQVPLADACAFGGIAALVIHFTRAPGLTPAVLPLGVALVAGASLLVMRLLFGRATSAHGARVQALLAPPLVGAVAGAVLDRVMLLGPPGLELAVLGVDMGGGAGEVAVVAVLSAFAGLLGTALLLPQVVVINRARAAPEEDAARLGRIASALAVVTWAAAFAIGAAAFFVASPIERSTAIGLLVAAAIGLCAQAMKSWLAREQPTAMTVLPYR